MKTLNSLDQHTAKRVGVENSKLLTFLVFNMINCIFSERFSGALHQPSLQFSVIKDVDNGVPLLPPPAIVLHLSVSLLTTTSAEGFLGLPCLPVHLVREWGCYLFLNFTTAMMNI